MCIFPHNTPFEPIFPFLESQRLLHVTWTCLNIPWTHRHASCNWKAVSIYPAAPWDDFPGWLRSVYSWRETYTQWPFFSRCWFQLIKPFWVFSQRDLETSQQQTFQYDIFWGMPLCTNTKYFHLRVDRTVKEMGVNWMRSGTQNLRRHQKPERTQQGLKMVTCKAIIGIRCICF